MIETTTKFMFHYYNMPNVWTRIETDDVGPVLYVQVLHTPTSYTYSEGWAVGHPSAPIPEIIRRAVEYGYR